MVQAASYFIRILNSSSSNREVLFPSHENFPFPLCSVYYTNRCSYFSWFTRQGPYDLESFISLRSLATSTPPTLHTWCRGDGRSLLCDQQGISDTHTHTWNQAAQWCQMQNCCPLLQQFFCFPLSAPFLFLLNSLLHLLVPFPRGEAYLEQTMINPSNKSLCSPLSPSVIILSGTKAQFRPLNPMDNEIEVRILLFLT